VPNGDEPVVRGGIDPLTGRPRKFAYPPNLFVVDGGAPQVEAASDVLAELGVTDVAVCGLAKRLEEVWLPADPDPVILPRTSEGLYLLQRIRDEAHRFAITYHRKLRRERNFRSVLEEIPGIGDKRKRSLLAHFGSLRRIRAASAEEIEGVEGFNAQLAERVHHFLAAEQRAALEAEAREAAEGAASAGEGPQPEGEGPLATDRDDVAFDAAAAELEALEDAEVGEAEPIGPQEPEPSRSEPVSVTARRSDVT